MANFDEKILDGPNVGYCSSSEDEADVEASNSLEMPLNEGSNTGPKGVIEDYKAHQREIRRKLHEKELAVLKEAGRMTLEKPVNQDDDEDELEQIRQRRLLHMRVSIRGRINELKTKEEFLTATEDPLNLNFIYIYESANDAQVLHDALLEISSSCRNAKFFRIKSSILETSKKFTSKALPTLQIYQNGELLGNFVKIFDTLGEDFSTEELVAFLKKMFRNPSLTNVDLPLRIILVSKDESAERVLFIYPFESEISASKNECDELLMRNELDSAFFSSPNFHEDQFTVPVKVLAPLLYSKEGTVETPFEIKIDNYCFAGYPLRIENSAHSLAVGFVLPGSAPSHIIDSFQMLSKKIAIAINSEQKRCGYLKEQIALMLPSIEEYEVESLAEDVIKSPYPTILEKSGLAKHLREIFNDVREYGMVDVFVDDCIEVGFCIEPKALLQAGLTPKSSKEVDKIMRQVQPYHGILFLEDTLPSPDSNPFVMKFLNEYEPDRSIEEMSKSAGLPLAHVLLIVKHYLKWARAVIIYPICNSNIYTTAPSNIAFQKVASQFSEQFDCSLAEILELFSPPCSLEAFRNDTVLYTPVNIRMKMLMFLLRNQLIIQLHTYFFLLPPFSTLALPNFDSSLLSARCRTLINERKEIDDEIKLNLIRICGELSHSGMSEMDIFWLLSSFISILPFLNGRHHFEDIMYTRQLDRTNARRLFDTFSPILATFCNQDFIAD